MGASLKDFVSDPQATGAPLRIPATGKRLPKSNIIGVALVPKNTLPDIGSAAMFTPPGGGTAVTVTEANLVSLLAVLAFNGMAWVFGNGVINGKKSKFKGDEEPMVFGSRRTKRDTGEGESTYMIVFKYAYLNADFFNQLRLNYIEYDIYVFTDRSVEVVRYDAAEPVFKDTNNGEITGSNTDEISSGGFNIVIGTDGEISPNFGNFEAGLAISNFKYSFNPVVTATGLTNVLGGTQFNMATGTGGSITHTLVQTVAANVVSYGIFAADGSAAPAGVTVSSATGVITVAGTLPIGVYSLKLIVTNQTGIMGEKAFRIVVA